MKSCRQLYTVSVETNMSFKVIKGQKINFNLHVLLLNFIVQSHSGRDSVLELFLA